jgi:hypothetical protein
MKVGEKFERFGNGEEPTGFVRLGICHALERCAGHAGDVRFLRERLFSFEPYSIYFPLGEREYAYNRALICYLMAELAEDGYPF